MHSHRMSLIAGVAKAPGSQSEDAANEPRLLLILT